MGGERGRGWEGRTRRWMPPVKSWYSLFQVIATS